LSSGVQRNTPVTPSIVAPVGNTRPARLRRLNVTRLGPPATVAWKVSKLPSSTAWLPIGWSTGGCVGVAKTARFPLNSAVDPATVPAAVSSAPASTPAGSGIVKWNRFVASWPTSTPLTASGPYDPVPLSSSSVAPSTSAVR
jgi:hypothetical protein